jgi:hypothetical protein
MGVCWYGAPIPDGVDYNKLAQRARQEYADLGFEPAATVKRMPQPAFDPDQFMAEQAAHAERIQAIHNREFLIALGQ